MLGPERLNRQKATPMLARIRHLAKRAYAIPSKIDEILVTLDRLAPAEVNELGVPEGQNPFWHWQSSFDAVGVMRKYGAPKLKASPNHLTNYLGVKIDPAFFPEIL